MPQNLKLLASASQVFGSWTKPILAVLEEKFGDESALDMLSHILAGHTQGAEDIVAFAKQPTDPEGNLNTAALIKIGEDIVQRLEAELATKEPEEEEKPEED